MEQIFPNAFPARLVFVIVIIQRIPFHLIFTGHLAGVLRFSMVRPHNLRKTGRAAEFCQDAAARPRMVGSSGIQFAGAGNREARTLQPLPRPRQAAGNFGLKKAGAFSDVVHQRQKRKQSSAGLTFHTDGAQRRLGKPPDKPDNHLRRVLLMDVQRQPHAGIVRVSLRGK